MIKNRKLHKEKKFSFSIDYFQLELDRINFLLKSYLRIRLYKASPYKHISL